jgi:sugar phosphate isomerase/epimerase
MKTDGSSTPISCDNAPEIRRHLDELLPQFLAFAKKLGAAKVTVFSLPRPAGATGAPPAVVIDSLAQAAQAAGREGITLLIENGAGSWADSPAATAGILKAVNSPALRLVWDPANDINADPTCDPLAGFDLVRPFLAVMHVKDIERVGAKTQWAMLGTGCVDWPRLTGLLRKSGYQGPYTLEPHLQYRPGVVDLVTMMEDFLARARKVLQA